MSNQNVKSSKPSLDKCPCKKSDQQSWMLDCTSCKQGWHSACANIKGKNITKSFILALEDWLCPWCFECPAPKPSAHPASKREQTLFATAISDAIVTNVTDSVNNVTESIMSTIDNKLKSIVDNSLETTLNKLVHLELDRLQKFKDEVIELKEKCDTCDEPSPHLNLNVDNPTDHIKDYKENFINSDTKNEICNFLNQQTFFNLKGRSVISFGEKYTYNGSGPPGSHHKAIPNVLHKVMQSIESNFKGSEINSCLVNKYTGKSSFLPKHSDDESTIQPGSHIFTVSIGASCTLTFQDSFNGTERAVPVSDCSLYSMSQSSQCFWTHRIDKNDISEGEDVEDTIRYSLTFRFVGDRFKNSTIILGDSNTKHLKFGTGAGNFGYHLPGKRVETFHIKDIDPVSCIGFQNIVIHVGINDLLDRSPGRTKDDLPPTDIQGHLAHFASKIEAIQQLCPGASIIISPLLPTKLGHINQRVVNFNMSLYDYIVRANTKLRFLDFHCFLDNEGKLDSGLGLYNQPRDNVHLGKLGIRLLAKLFRENILIRGRIDGRLYSSVLHDDNAAYPHFALS